MAAGTPVIASDLEVFHEIAGDIPEYLSPDDVSGWRSIIEDYMGDDSRLRTAQMIRSVMFEPPNWESHFAKAEKLIH